MPDLVGCQKLTSNIESVGMHLTTQQRAHRRGRRRLAAAGPFASPPHHSSQLTLVEPSVLASRHVTSSILSSLLPSEPVSRPMGHCGHQVGGAPRHKFRKQHPHHPRATCDVQIGDARTLCLRWPAAGRARRRGGGDRGQRGSRDRDGRRWLPPRLALAGVQTRPATAHRACDDPESASPECTWLAARLLPRLQKRKARTK